LESHGASFYSAEKRNSLEIQDTIVDKLFQINYPLIFLFHRSDNQRIERGNFNILADGKVD